MLIRNVKGLNAMPKIFLLRKGQVNLIKLILWWKYEIMATKKMFHAKFLLTQKSLGDGVIINYYIEKPISWLTTFGDLFRLVEKNISY